MPYRSRTDTPARYPMPLDWPLGFDNDVPDIDSLLILTLGSAVSEDIHEIQPPDGLPIGGNVAPEATRLHCTAHRTARTAYSGGRVRRRLQETQCSESPCLAVARPRCQGAAMSRDSRCQHAVRVMG